MGGVVGRPRRGLPDNPRYLPPGRYVRDVRDGDVLVLCSADAPLNLTVVPGRHPDDDGAWLGHCPISQAFVVTEAPWGLRPSFDWLARTARRPL